jgi:hypothetical protein
MKVLIHIVCVVLTLLCIRTHIKVKSRIRTRIKMKSRIRIRYASKKKGESFGGSFFTGAVEALSGAVKGHFD